MTSLPKSINTGFSVRGGERDSIVGSLGEIWRFRPLILELVRRDLKVRYKNRVGGALWSLFPPLMQVLTITVMVKFFLGQVPNYSAYLMTVMFLWQFFQNTVLDASQSMIVNGPLVRKIYFPRAVLPLVTFISNFLHFGVAFAFVLVYLLVVQQGRLTFSPFFWMAPFYVVGMGAFGLGIGYLLAYLTTLYDDIKFLSVTLLGLFFYLVPVLYPIERVANNPQIYPFYMLNPAAVWLVAFQRSFLPAPLDSHRHPLGPTIDIWPWLGLATLVSVVMLVAGFWIFERSKWTMMERL